MEKRKFLGYFWKKIKKFIFDIYGGNLVEYALLIGFALFIFFLIIGVITSMLNWTVGLSNDFLDLFSG